MYLIDLPSLSSLNLLTHSGATVTLVVGSCGVSGDGLKLIYSWDFPWCIMHGFRKLGEAYPDLLCVMVSTCSYVAGGDSLGGNGHTMIAQAQEDGRE